MLKFEKDNVIVLEIFGYSKNVTIKQTEYTTEYLWAPV